MEDQKAKQMISTDHQFVSHQPRKKKRHSVPELFFKRTGKYRTKKIPELNTSKWMKSVLKVSQTPALLPSLGSCERRKALPQVRFAAALGRCSPRPRARSAPWAGGVEGRWSRECASSPGSGEDQGCLCHATLCRAREPSCVPRRAAGPGRALQREELSRRC